MPNVDPAILQDAARLQAILDTSLLDTPREAAFDRLTRLACRILHVPVSLISLVEVKRQFLKSQYGLGDLSETPISHSFCQHVVASSQPLVIPDALKHPLVYDNPACVELDVLSYLGIPLITSSGYTLGSFCVIDHKPREWSQEEIEIVTDLAQSVMTEIELRTELRQRAVMDGALLAQEYFNRKIMDTIPAIICIYDIRQARLTFANEFLHQALGYITSAPEDFTADFIRELFHPDDVHHFNRMISVAHEQEKYAVFEYRLRHAEGGYRWFRHHAAVFMLDETGNPAQTINMLQDITHVRNTSRQLFNQQLEHEQMRLASEFVQNLSHDLRTPLATIQTNLDLLARSPERVEQRIDMMQRQLRHMARALDELTEAAFLTDMHTLQKSAIQVNQLLRDVTEWLQQILGSSSYPRIFFDLYEQLPMLAGDPDKLPVALGAVVENALTYTPADGSVIIRTRRQDDRLVVEIEDSGQGIAPEDLERIFDPFFKSNRARTGNSSRTGLGLTITRKIVELHGGSITVSSAVDTGTIFRIDLPFGDSAVAG